MTVWSLSLFSMIDSRFWRTSVLREKWLLEESEFRKLTNLLQIDTIHPVGRNELQMTKFTIKIGFLWKWLCRSYHKLGSKTHSTGSVPLSVLIGSIDEWGFDDKKNLNIEAHVSSYSPSYMWSYKCWSLLHGGIRCLFSLF